MLAGTFHGWNNSPFWSHEGSQFGLSLGVHVPRKMIAQSPADQPASSPISRRHLYPAARGTILKRKPEHPSLRC